MDAWKRRPAWPLPLCRESAHHLSRQTHDEAARETRELGGPVEERREPPQVVGREPAEEQFTHACVVRHLGLSQTADTVRRERDEKAAPVALVLLPVDQAAGGETCDGAGHPAGACEHAFGDVGHPHLPVRVGDERDQDAVVQERQIVLADQPLVQFIGDGAVRTEEPSPDLELLVRERVRFRWFRSIA